MMNNVMVRNYKSQKSYLYEKKNLFRKYSLLSCRENVGTMDGFYMVLWLLYFCVLRLQSSSVVGRYSCPPVEAHPSFFFLVLTRNDRFQQAS